MTSFGTLYSFTGHGFGARILAIAAYADVDVHLVEGFEPKVSNRTPEFLAKFPLGKIPAFEGADGFKITETYAISRYIIHNSKNPRALLGGTLEEEAKINQWISFGADIMMFATEHDFKPYFEPAGAFCRTAIVNLLKTLNTHLESRTYLVTERITHADIVVASVLKTVFAKHVDKAGREAAPNVVRFYDTVGNQPKLKEFLGEPKWLEKFVRPTGK